MTQARFSTSARWETGDDVTIVEHRDSTRQPIRGGQILRGTVIAASEYYARVRVTDGREATFWQGSGWTAWDGWFRWRLAAPCPVCRGTGAVTTPDLGRDSAHETACTEPGCTAPFPVAADLASTGEEPF